MSVLQFRKDRTTSLQGSGIALPRIVIQYNLIAYQPVEAIEILLIGLNTALEFANNPFTSRVKEPFEICGITKSTRAFRFGVST